LKTLKGKKAVVVVGGGSMKRFGFLDKIVSYLKEAGMQVEIFENVEPDPSVETVLKGAEAMRKFEPDWIVSLGGGSPIDAAKAMWVFYEYPETKFEQLINPFSFPELRQKAKFIAIPSTSGTATEVTAFSVITDYSKGVKYPLADYNITPDIAILAPEIAETMPQTLTAHTGMDALTHAIEAYVSRMNSPFTDPLAIKAIQMVFEYLPASFKGDKTAREQMHYAQCLAGMAFSNALLGIVHSMAHKTGAAFSTGHIPHGCANAIYLPYVIEFNVKNAESRFADIAKAVGITAGSDREAVTELCKKIDACNEAFGIPKTLKEFGILEGEFKEKVASIAELAVGDACTGANPRRVSPGEMEKLLNCVYYGTRVDF
jgi:alcohol dehydrogenase class IV